MSDQVLRIKTRSSAGGALAGHIRGSKRPDNASLDPDNVPVILDEDPGAVAWAQAHRPTGRGRPPKPAIEIVVAGIPPYASKRYKREGWTRAKELEFARATLDWIKKRAGPNSRVAVAAWHVDESAGHLHALVVPVSAQGKLGWKAIRDQFDPGGGPPSLRMSRIQDRFHAEVAAGYGMARGVKGSTAKHEPIDRDAAIKKLDAKREDQAQLQRKLEDLQGRLDRFTAIWNAVKIWSRRALKQLAPAVLDSATSEFEAISNAAAGVGLNTEGWRPPLAEKSPQRSAEAAPGAKPRPIKTPAP